MGFNRNKSRSHGDKVFDCSGHIVFKLPEKSIEEFKTHINRILSGDMPKPIPLEIKDERR